MLKHVKGPNCRPKAAESPWHGAAAGDPRRPSMGPGDSAAKARGLGSWQAKMYGKGYTVRITVTLYALHRFFF